MARLTDLADELRPLILEGDKLDSALKQKVTLDLDTKDAQKQFTTFEQKLSSLKSAVSDMQKSGQDATETYSKLGQTAAAGIAIIATKFQEVGEQIKSITAQIIANNERINASGGTKKSGFVKGLEDETAQLQRQLESRKRLQQEYERERQSLSDSYQSEIGGALGVSSETPKQAESLTGFQKAMSEADVSWIYQTKMSLEELKATYKDLLEAKKSMETGKPVSLMSDSEAKEYAQILASMNEIAYLIHGAKSKESPLGNTNNIAEPQKIEQEFNSLTELKQCISETKGELDALREKAKSGQLIDVDKSVAEAKALEAELKRLESMRVALEGKEQKKEEKPKQTDNAVQEQKIQSYMTLKDLIKDTLATQSQLAQAKMTLPFSSDIQGAQNGIKSLSSHMKELKSIWSNIGGGAIIQTFNLIKNSALSLGKTIGNGVKAGVSGAISAIKSFGSGIQSVASGAFNALKSAISTAIGAFNTLKSAISSTIGNMHRLVSGGFNAVVRGANAIKSTFQAVSSQVKSLVKKGTPNLMKSFGSFKSMLMRRIKRTFISSIFNQAKEGLQQLAKSSADFNKSMSNIKNSAKQAAGNLSMVLGNLIQTLEPALMTLLSWFNRVMEAINGLFAMLTGKKTMLVAKQNTDDYAKSLKGAGGAAKDLNHQLYGFDELTRQEDESGGGSGGKIEYEEKEVSDVLGGINDFFKQMLEAFNQGQFERVGELIAEQLNNVTKAIDEWVIGLRPEATKWSQNIARIFNGMLQPELFQNMGNLVGDGLNLVFDVVNTFLNQFEFDKFGQVVATGINSMFDRVEWDLVGETFAHYFNSLWDFIGNLFDKLNWSDIGTKFATGFTSFFNNIDWGTYRNMLSKGINGVFSLLNSFASNVDWAGIASTIDTNLTELIEKDIDWNGIGNTLSTLANHLLSVFNVLADSNFFIKLGEKLGGTFGKVLNNINWAQLASDIVTGLAKLRTAFWTLIDSIDIPNLSSKLAGAINGLLTDSRVKSAWSESTKKATDGINGLVKAFSNIVSDPPVGIDFVGIGSTIGKNINTFLSGIDWETLASSITIGIGKLTSAFWAFIDDLDVPSLTTKISSSINSLMSDDKVQKAWDDADALAIKGINSIIDAFNTIVKPASEGGLDILGIATKLGERVFHIFDGISWKFLGETARLGLAKVAEAFDGFVTGINFAQIASDLASGINTFFDPNADINFGTIASRVSSGLNGIIEGFGSLVSDIKFEDIRKSLTEGISTLLLDTDWDGLIKTIGDGVVRASTEFFKLVSNVFSSQNEDGESLGEKLTKGINGIFQDENGELDVQKFVNLGESLGEAIKSIFSNINDFITKTDWGDIGTAIGEALGSIDWLGIAKSMITMLWNALVAAVNLVGGLVGGFIRKLFGITDVQVFDATGVEWANQLAESIRTGMEGSTAQQKIALAAAGYATGMADSYISELDSRTNDIRMQAEHVAHEVARGIEDIFASEKWQDLEEAKSTIMTALSISDVEAEKIIETYKNGELSQLTYEDIMQGLYNAKNADDVVEFFRQLGVTIPTTLAGSLSEATPEIGRVSRELISNLQQAETLEEALAYFKQAGLDVGENFASAIAGEATENISAALALLGMGVDEATITALDTSHLAENLDNYMKSSGDDLTKIAKDLGADVGEGIGYTIPDAIAKALDIGTQEVERVKGEMVNKATTTAEDINSGREQAETFAENITGGIAETTEEGQQDVEDATENITSAVLQKYEELPEEVKPYAEQLMEYIVTALEDGDGTVKSAIEAVAQSAVDRAKEILSADEGTAIAETFINGMRDYLTSDATLAMFKGESSASAQIGNAVKNGIEDILTEANGLAIGSAFATNIKMGIDNTQVDSGADYSPRDWAELIDSEVSEVLSRDNGTVAGEEYAFGVVSGIDGTDVYNTTSEWGSRVVNAIAGYINESNGKIIGSNMIIGMINGFNSYGQTLVNTIAHICNVTASTARRILGIASPSKVFAEIGSYTMQGMQVGLEKGGDYAIDTVSDIASAIIDEAQNGNNITMSIDTMTEGLDTVTDKMTRLAIVFNDIASTISDMGGLNIPTVATGKVIPYRTKVDTSTLTNETQIDSTNLEDAIFSAFNRAMGMEQNQQPIEIKLVVDGRTLADIVTKKQREQERAWGY